jgi:hypothetical protein
MKQETVLLEEISKLELDAATTTEFHALMVELTKGRTFWSFT